MFYEASEIDTLIICRGCENKMREPRLLPCGLTLCTICIATLTDKEKQNIDCLGCKSIY